MFNLNILSTKPNVRILIVLIALLFYSCSDSENPVPYTTTDYTIYNLESDAQYTALRSIYNGVEIVGRNECLGYKCNGIFVYRLQNYGEQDDFVAYDRTCPHEKDTCLMMWDKNEPYYLKCNCCGSKYNLVGGYLEKGPSKFGPRKITCDYLNGNLYIR